MHKWIAEEVFRCAPRKGKTFTLRVLIGTPETVSREAKLPEYGRVCVSLLPLCDERWIGGTNQFHALCNSIEYVRTVLKVFAAEGGRVSPRDADGTVDLNTPCFLPMMSLGELKLIAKQQKARK